MKIVIKTQIFDNVKEVWKYYTNPKHITQWNFANNDWHCPFAENDLKVGGKMLSTMEAKDGSYSFNFEGIYNEIIPFKKIIYTMPDNRQVCIHFKRIEDRTEITIEFDAENKISYEDQKGGWQAILNNFKNYVESR